eukprot:TRINITY_DN6277_c0_g1_i1.p1 TRINITY_DN6277_c0_g1~~TRINITY_DN6277_c0_g1_i1.p1  ORF type:complete len:435 (+),score=106.69 TRINITY_DN6277_c0_g1_i1:197-1501(+)
MAHDPFALCSSQCTRRAVAVLVMILAVPWVLALRETATPSVPTYVRVWNSRVISPTPWNAIYLNAGGVDAVRNCSASVGFNAGWDQCQEVKRDFDTLRRMTVPLCDENEVYADWYGRSMMGAHLAIALHGCLVLCDFFQSLGKCGDGCAAAAAPRYHYALACLLVWVFILPLLAAAAVLEENMPTVGCWWFMWPSLRDAGFERNTEGFNLDLWRRAMFGIYGFLALVHAGLEVAHCLERRGGTSGETETRHPEYLAANPVQELSAPPPSRRRARGAGRESRDVHLNARSRDRNATAPDYMVGSEAPVQRDVQRASPRGARAARAPSAPLAPPSRNPPADHSYTPSSGALLDPFGPYDSAPAPSYPHPLRRGSGELAHGPAYAVPDGGAGCAFSYAPPSHYEDYGYGYGSYGEGSYAGGWQGEPPQAVRRGSHML